MSVHVDHTSLCVCVSPYLFPNCSRDKVCVHISPTAVVLAVPSESDSVRLAGMFARSVTIFERAASRGTESAKRWSPGSCGGNKQARNGACLWVCAGETFFHPAAVARISTFAPVL